ncbi:MAG: AAA family ATPase [Armatimonadota bacterium]|nr:AAA family ATPase [Armatimonadota bacterium]
MKGTTATRGLVIGKFLPPHRGHQYLIDFARASVDHLTIQVCTLKRQPIPGLLRYEWVREAFPDVQVVHNADENPEYPEDAPETFWETWRRSCLAHMDAPPTHVFAAETYGEPLAALFGAEYVPVDPARAVVPMSGSRLLQDPTAHWDYLLPSARPYFLKRVAILGPESSGKTTLASRLAAEFETLWAPEYGRTYLDALPRTIDAAVMETIARGHRASETSLARQARRVLISDTDPIITQVWCEFLLGVVPPVVKAYIQDSAYDLYLLTDATEEWVADPQRFLPERHRREQFHDRCREILTALGRPFVFLHGSWEQRQETAQAAITALLHSS